MAVFNPTLFTGSLEVPAIEQMPDFGPAPDVAPPVAQPPAVPPQPVFVPVPVVMPKKKKMTISPEAVRKAQGIYPVEQQAKAEMMDRAQAAPTPTGAWGAPE